MKIYLTVYDYDFIKTGGYGWTEVQEKTVINKSLDDLINDLMNEFDADYNGNIWQDVKFDIKGRPTMFIMHHENSTKEYVYEITY